MCCNFSAICNSRNNRKFIGGTLTMEITNVKIRRLIDDGTMLKAIVSITIDKAFAVHDLKILEKEKGNHFIAMPSWKDSKGEWHDFAHPINQETRDKITDAILPVYYNLVTEKED